MLETHCLETNLNSRKTGLKIREIYVDFQNFRNFEIPDFEVQTVCPTAISSRLRRALRAAHVAQLAREASNTIQSS